MDQKTVLVLFVVALLIGFAFGLAFPEWIGSEYARGFERNNSYVLAIGEVLDNVIVEDSPAFGAMWDTLQWLTLNVEGQFRTLG